jgi:hypothetical protein
MIKGKRAMTDDTKTCYQELEWIFVKTKELGWMPGVFLHPATLRGASA